MREVLCIAGIPGVMVYIYWCFLGNMAKIGGM